MWTPAHGERVAVTGLGLGTVVKATPRGAIVELDAPYSTRAEFNTANISLVEGAAGSSGMQAARTGAAASHSSPQGNGPAVAAGSAGAGAAQSHSPPLSNAAPAASGHLARIGQLIGARPKPPGSGGVQVPSLEPGPGASATSGGTPPAAAPSPMPAPPLSDPGFEARCSLEALRFGLVPHRHIEQFTLGYEQLSKWINSSFPVLEPRVHKVIGAYGTGKSHMMSAIRTLAKREGYMVAHVEVNGEGMTLSDPAKLIHAIYSTLHSQEEETEYPLVGLLEKVIQNSTSSYLPLSGLRAVDAHLGVVSMLQHAGTLDIWTEQLEAVFSGSDEVSATDLDRALRKQTRASVQVFPAVPRSLLDRPNGLVESLLGTAWLAKAAGYKGLIITIDEFETENKHLTKAQKQKLMLTLRAIECYVSGQRNLPKVPLALYFGTVGDSMDEGDVYLNDLVEASGGSALELRFFQKEERLELANRIYRFYQEAYQLQRPYDPNVADRVHTLLDGRGYVESELLRQFIKWYMAFLDVLYGPPKEMA